MSITRTSLTLSQSKLLTTDHDRDSDPNLVPLEQPLVSKPTHLGDQVWLGANITVLKGVTIRSNTVVVASDLHPDVVAVGVPAKVIRSYDKQIIHF